MRHGLNIIMLMCFALSSMSGQSISNPDSIRYDIEEIFVVVEQMPLFGGCTTKDCSDARARQFIKDNLVYPEEAMELALEDTIKTWFVVDIDGTIESASVRGKGKSVFAKSSEEVIMKMNTAENAWSPGYQRGVPVRVLLKIPVEYSL